MAYGKGTRRVVKLKKKRKSRHDKMAARDEGVEGAGTEGHKHQGPQAENHALDGPYQCGHFEVWNRGVLYSYVCRSKKCLPLLVFSLI